LGTTQSGVLRGAFDEFITTGFCSLDTFSSAFG
jgi:hypothetical protein